jgi:hypothetical protein
LVSLTISKVSRGGRTNYYLNNFYTIYLNNILIYLDNKLEYKIYIKKVF